MNKPILVLMALLFIVILSSGCIGSSSQKYEKDGISFNYPSDWKLNGNGTNHNIHSSLQHS